LHIYDLLKLELKPVAIDGIEDGTLLSPFDSLKVTLAATHVGYTNKNGFQYVDGEATEESLKSWVKPFSKPVIPRHDSENQDPLGRVLNAYRVDYVPPENADADADHPTGVVMLDALITNEEGINKVLKGEYLTVSVKSEPEEVRCSICNQDLQEDGFCDHDRKKEYDGETCSWLIGKRTYKEVSFVNEPADTSENHFAGIVAVGTADADDIPEDMEGAPKAIMDAMEEADKESFAIISDAHNSEIEINPAVAKDEEDEEEPDPDAWTQDDMDLLLWLEDEVDKALEEDEHTKDAKLSEKQKKSMDKKKGSHFCGPNDPRKGRRSFPVPDCAHVTAAKRLLGKYKGPGDKSKIRACIERRGRALGCGGSDKKDEEITSQTVTLTEQLEHANNRVAELEARLTPETIFDEETVKTRVDELTTEIEDAKTKIETMQATIDGLNMEIEEGQSNSAVVLLEDQNTKLYLLIHRLRAEMVTDMEIACGQHREFMDESDPVEARTGYVKATMEEKDSAELAEMYTKLATTSNYGMAARPTTPTTTTDSPGLDREPPAVDKTKRSKTEERKARAKRLILGPDVTDSKEEN
jgi:hypothetical protein